MLKKTITYKNPFTGEPKTEDFYFNISKAEATELAMIEGEGMDDRIRALMASEDGHALLGEFKKIVALSYCKRDGNDILKSPELSAKFMASEAYSELFLEFIGSPEKANEFIRGLLPTEADLKEILARIEESTGQKIDSSNEDAPKVLEATTEEVPAWIRENREPTKDEIRTMSPDQLREAYMRKSTASSN